MFQVSEIRSAITLMLVMGVVVPGFALAQSAIAGVAGETQQVEKSKVKSAESAEAPVVSDWGGLGNVSLLGNDAVIGANQQSATAGYELSGAGVASGRLPAQGILTAQTRGRPITFENGVYVYPSALIGYGRNDNVLGTQTNKVASNFTVLQPQLVAEIKRAGDRYTFNYIGNYARYSNSGADDYDHHELWAAADNYFTSRLRLGVGVGYIESSDARGSTNRTTSAAPDRWHAPVARVLGIYGAPGAMGRLELESSLMQKRYENNRVNTEASDVDIAVVSGRFFYRVLPKTLVVFEMRETWSDYPLATSTQDNSDRRLYAGLTWDATAKTTGTVKVGRAYKNFDSGARQDASMGSWEASVRWSPMTYSVVDFVTSKAPADSTGLGNFTTNTASTLVWNHRWASYISSRLSTGLIKTDYSGADRHDDTRNYGIGFYRELGYRLRLGLDWNRTDRGSNQTVNEFKRDVTMVTLEGVL